MGKDEDDRPPKHAGPQKQDKPFIPEKPTKESGDGQGKGGGTRGK
ncbi:hypothetical protein AB0C10_32080 [Microbispora amethystogenes]|nr:hypothetical protein [Microbispora cellulosiformans]